MHLYHVGKFVLSLSFGLDLLLAPYSTDVSTLIAIGLSAWDCTDLGQIYIYNLI
jgi:hypothetical protein